MSILTMAVSTINNPNKQTIFNYNKGLWQGNISVDNLDIKDGLKLINYLNNKYDKVYYFRIDRAKTFGGKFIKPKDIFKNDMDDESAIPNCIMVATGGVLKLITTKAKRAKEFVEFNSSARNIYVPVFIYKDINKQVKLINLK